MAENEEVDSDFKFFSSLQGNVKPELSMREHMIQFMYVIIMVFSLIFLLTCNFIAMSASLNINKEDTSNFKYIYALGAFMFGFMYIVGNIMFLKIGQRNETIEFDSQKLFPI